jgi:hypothetical protein
MFQVFGPDPCGTGITVGWGPWNPAGIGQLVCMCMIFLSQRESWVEIDVGQWDREKCVMLWETVPGHLILKHFQAAGFIQKQPREQYGNIQNPASTLFPKSTSINRHISRAVLPVRAMCSLASLA